MDVYLPSGDVVQPDVGLVTRPRSGIVQDWIRGAPDLVVEVISPTHVERDRLVKRDLYARNGVPEYWLVDPGAGTIEVFRLRDDAYRPAGYFQRGSVLASESLPEFRLPIDEVFA
jgi:Uma2 family endonuclease